VLEAENATFAGRIQSINPRCGSRLVLHETYGNVHALLDGIRKFGSVADDAKIVDDKHAFRVSRLVVQNVGIGELGPLARRCDGYTE